MMSKLLLGNDDSFGTPIERIFIATNGPESGIAITRCAKVSRQTLQTDIGRITH